MPCWPNLWQSFKDKLPFFGVIGALLAYIALLALLLWAPRIPRRWMRVTSRILGAAGVVPLIFLLPAFLLGMMWASSNPPAQIRTFQSPNGNEATLRYNAGFLGRDYTEVTLKQPGCCRRTIVFWHAGPSEFDDMTIKWVDNQHLHLTYHVRPEDPQHCENKMDGVTIICTSLPWPDTANSVTPETTKKN